MGTSRTKYSKEYKESAVKLITEQGLSATQAARDLGFSENMLHRWKRELLDHGEKAFPGNGLPIEQELTALRKEVETLRMERDIFKKSHHLLRQAPSGEVNGDWKAEEDLGPRYGFIAAYRHRFGVEKMCGAVRVRPSGFYAALKRGKCSRRVRDEELKVRIRHHFDISRG